MDQVTSYSPCWVRGGRLEEIVWIGRDVLAWCTGLYIVFFHVVKKQQTLHWCWNDATGDGARCISGHVSAPIFAFSERSLKPRILVLEYPSMTRVCECVGGCDSGYLATAFTPDNYLVSLGSHPNFPMIVWCWRTGKKIATVNTSIRDGVGQTIRITLMGRTVIGQMGKTCGKLLTWELDVVDKIIILKDHEVKLPGDAVIRGIDWCPTNRSPNDPLLAITDADGHVYLSNYDGTNVLRVVFSQRCGICVDIEAPIVHWFRDGIILKTTFCQIRYFKKEPTTDVWRKQWYVKSTHKPHILVAHPSKNWLFYYTLEGYLMQMVFPEDESARVMPSVHRYLHHGGKYRFVDFLYPWCHHLVATDDLKELTIFESYSGSEIARVELDIEGSISAQASHPDDPLIVVVSDHGEMIILGVTDPEQPTILAYFRLQMKLLDLIKFSHSGKFLIVAQKETGNCYCVNLRRDTPWQVMAQVQVKGRFADVMLYDDETRGSLKVLVLYARYEPFRSVGQQLLVYDVPYLLTGADHRLITETVNDVTLPALFYELCHAPDDPWLLIGSPYLERQLYTLKLRRNFEGATLTEAAPTGHHVRLARVFADHHWIVTCAYDGLVVIRDRTIRQIVDAVPVHHRLDSGSRKIVVNPDGDTVVALGHDGSLVATRIRHESEKVLQESKPSLAVTETKSVYPVDYEWYEKRKENILLDYASLDQAIRASLTRARTDFPAAGEKEFATWEEWQQNVQLQEEARFYAKEKAAITKNLEALKTTVRQLLDANETCSEMERLPVSAFDLNRAGREQKLKTARDEREDARMELEHICTSMERVVGWMKAAFWDPQVVLGRSIFSFRDDTEVTNYPLMKEDPYFKEHLRWAQFSKDSVRSTVCDTFQPWHSYTDDQLHAELSKSVRVYREEERRRMDLLLKEEGREIDPEELAKLRAVDGMTTHRFVEQSPYYYSQMESYGFAHVMLDNCYLMHDYSKLYAYFNGLFDDMYATKEREANVIRERNERIRHIDSELRIMFGQSVPEVPVDPQWHPKEKVESIIQVLHDEVKAKPYVSPSQQDILDRQKAEAEQIRKLLLADDFRERALMKMMDGMLEIRWEDTIKIDVRKPLCMLEKQPEQYTSDDILVVKKYEADVETLRQERERYRRMLEADYAKINGLLQEGIDKFDAKLDELFQLKLRVEAAMNQLKLRYIRGCLRNLARIEAVKEDDRVKQEISKKRRYENTLEEHAQKLHAVYQDMLTQHDALCTREKTLVKKFQHEFAALSRVNVELLERQYKRRPKVSLKNSIAISDLFNLAKYLVDRIEPAYFPAECADYSKILDGLDARPTGLPQQIDSSHWDHLTQLRRQKINVELKIRARQLEIAAAERTIAVFESKINACKSSVALFKDRFRTTRDERITCEQDAEVQLVLKRGQVELELRGERRDAADAVLVPREEIERVNEHIRVAGARKLNALKRTIDFRHGMLSIEWEHRCLRTRFKELEEDLHFIRDVTATRDMRTYLKRKTKGLRDDKTAVHLEREIDTARKSLDKTLSKEMNKLEKLRQRITSIKRKNAELDRTITEMNVARWELEYQRDVIGEIRQYEHMDWQMRLFRQRSDLIRKLQDNYAELLTLQTEHELLRLRTYPTLYFRTLDNKDEVCQ
ncbi:PREDICTED: cilia- and flagella-associated protein 43-like [Wasmannia auropunctata]|uniref:cilia- and flagella-associated protein 43-like n=1 Tax=Wasmannia auropunctata TaxID=64793 RepID=UPI0005EFFF4D|nr:PREDICTED: cilia- and flagella-associated protein 43-like [Wasmannia auropunctata]